MICFYCGKEFDLSGKQGGQNRIFCQECIPDGLTKDVAHHIRRRLYLDKANQQKKELGCSICGYNKYGEVLEWHHIDPNIKDFNPGDIMRDCSMKKWEWYQNEIKKCVLMCANCHREWHVEHRE